MRWLQASVLVAWTLSACGTPEPALQQEPADASAPDSIVSGATSVAFNDDGPLTMLPGEARDVTLQVEPPGVHAIRLALFGASLDASLDEDYVGTDPAGRASVKLTAPRSATTFRIRATADDGPSDELAVSVSADGFATVLVRASGYGGRRPTPTWTASAVARTMCAAVPGAPPTDGPIVATGSDGGAVRLDGLPVGPGIAVTLRAGKSVGGCRDIKDLTAGETRAVDVPVVDAPIDEGATDVLFRMSMGTDDAALRAALEKDGVTFEEMLFPLGSSQASTLLDTMVELAMDPAELASARSAGDWDQVVGAMLDDQGLDLREEVGRWVVRGLDPLWKVAMLDGRLTANGGGNGHALLVPTEFAGLESGDVGLAASVLVSLEALPSDTLQIGGSLLWFPSQLIATAADEGARKLAAPSASGQEALAAIYQCNTLSDELAKTTPLPASCDENCTRSLCESAVSTRWERAREASALQLRAASLTFTVSAAAEVTPEATVASFDGSWAGSYVSDSGAFALKGSAEATSP